MYDRNFFERLNAIVRYNDPRQIASCVSHRLIPLTKGQFAIVDADDYERLARYKWYAGGKKGQYYARRRANRITLTMHREIIDVPAGMVCDHINHNTLDNRKYNLRICTPAQNHYNRLPGEHGTSRYKGVCWNKDSRKWEASIGHQNRLIHIGYFEYAEDAAIAYDDMAVQLFGEFACLNFHYRPEIQKWIQQMYLFPPMKVDSNSFNDGYPQPEISGIRCVRPAPGPLNPARDGLRRGHLQGSCTGDNNRIETT